MAASQRTHATVVGNPSNFWLFSNRDGWDLTHPPTPTSSPIYPRLRFKTTGSDVTIAPSKTALVIIDMQNYFLSEDLGRERGPGHEAADVLLQYGIPAARRAGIQVVWLTWGIKDEELKVLPPVLFRIFGFSIADVGDHEVDDDGGFEGEAESPPKKLRRREKQWDGGLGDSIGNVTLGNGSVIDGGKLLMRDQWNTELYGKLKVAFEEGQNSKVPDVRFHKIRLSGLWGETGDMEKYLVKQGITTLLFTGINTDQCVLATLQDACNKSFDTLLLRDGCGTISPDYARKMVELNCEKSWGMMSSCKDLAQGNMEKSQAPKDEL